MGEILDSELSGVLVRHHKTFIWSVGHWKVRIALGTNALHLDHAGDPEPPIFDVLLPRSDHLWAGQV